MLTLMEQLLTAGIQVHRQTIYRSRETDVEVITNGHCRVLPKRRVAPVLHVIVLKKGACVT